MRMVLVEHPLDEAVALCKRLDSTEHRLNREEIDLAQNGYERLRRGTLVELAEEQDLVGAVIPVDGDPRNLSPAELDEAIRLFREKRAREAVADGR